MNIVRISTSKVEIGTAYYLYAVVLYLLINPIHWQVSSKPNCTSDPGFSTTGEWPWDQMSPFLGNATRYDECLEGQNME